MKALVVERYGSPMDLRLQDVARPEPGANEVLVKVHAASVNDYDWVLVRGKPRIYRLMLGLRAPRVKVPGAEVSGTVVAVGRGVAGFEPGDRVYGDLSEAGFGAFAEYVCSRADALKPMPPGMTFEQAAALPHASMLALQGLVDVGGIRRGDRVLINGAGGGVGMFAVQIAKQYGVEVTGVDRDFKLDALESIGFDHVVDYTVEDFTASGELYDLILDTRTNRSPLRYLKALRPGGRYVTVGGNVSRLLQCLLLKPLAKANRGKALRIVALKPNKDLEYMHQLFAGSGLQWLIDGPCRFEDLPQAIQRFGEAKHIGKIVVRVSA